MPTVEERFWSKVSVTDTCWLWTASTSTPNGYGQIKNSGAYISTHRFSWELFNGPIPDGMFVCHRCDVKRCVNPAHLFLGTPKDNMQDCLRKGRYNTPRGSATYNAKFSDEQVAELFVLRLVLSQKQLSERYGVCQPTISKILSRKRYV